MLLSMKKLLIALLGINAILIALLTAQAAQAKVKTYDAVKLTNYEKCLDYGLIVYQKLGGFTFESIIAQCTAQRP